MCRHNDKFYSFLIESVPLSHYHLSAIQSQKKLPYFSSASTTTTTTASTAVKVIELLCGCCKDNDPTTRKFASFALGNAAFYSDALYSFFIPSVPYLKSCLNDEDGKSRANAAGAIGNLVRNSGYLESILAEQNVPERLLKIALVDSDPAAQRNAISSLGTMAVYPQCRANILAYSSPSVWDIIRIVLDTARAEDTVKYMIRFQKKLQLLPRMTS